MDTESNTTNFPRDSAEACRELRRHFAGCAELIRLRGIACVEVLERALTLLPTNIKAPPWIDDD